MFLSSGEALFDVFVNDATGNDPHAVHAHGLIGGSTLNVALGLSRMGNQTDFFTRISNDVFGRRLRSFMDENRIGTRYCVATDQNTTLAMVSTQDDGSAEYSFYFNGTADCSIVPDDVPAVIDESIGVLHFGSFSTVFEPTGTTLRDFARREAGQRFISYDPNVRAMVVPDLDLWRTRIDEMLAISNFVKASDEDLELLYPDQPLEAFAERALIAGADIVCVTKGPEGAIVASADGRLIHAPGLDVSVIDTVGAGDTFQAASLHYINAENLAKAGQARDVDVHGLADFAIRAAALTCTRKGADLPTLAEIEAFRSGA